MSEITQVTSNGNNQVTNYDVSKVGLGDNHFIQAEFTASGDTEIAEGTVFGVISATGKLKVLDKVSIDNSQYPKGVLYNGIGGSKTVADGTTVTLTLINKGKVDSSKLVFADGTTVDSVVETQALKYWLNDLGLILESGSELSKVDN
ncbi:MAG: head decoration protein [Prolixibacteraceae bacterium]|jgi:hypothetical protein|nr:head decoration protein [Prolixibacteraceae bacterium]